MTDLKRFGTAEKMKTRTVNGAFWQYLKRFRTARHILTTRAVNGAFWRYLSDLEMQRKKWNNVFKAWILTVFKTIWNLYVKTCGCSTFTSIGLHFYVTFEIYIILSTRPTGSYASVEYPENSLLSIVLWINTQYKN